MNFTPTELGASIIFAIAVLHTFCTAYFEALAKKSPTHAGLWHLLGEVEIVFGFGLQFSLSSSPALMA